MNHDRPWQPEAFDVRVASALDAEREPADAERQPDRTALAQGVCCADYQYKCRGHRGDQDRELRANDRTELTATMTGTAISASIRMTPANIAIRTVGAFRTVTPASSLLRSA